MDTDKAQTRENLWASFKGSFIFTLMIFIFLVCAIIFIPSTPKDDGHIKEAATLISSPPVVFIVFFFYFFVLSLKHNRPLKLALILQKILITPIVLLVFFFAIKEAGFFSGCD
jgi:hypothetical protein